MRRKITLEQAKRQFVHRYTMDHVPAWALKTPADSGGTETRYYAPQYASDQEWYDNTIFPGEGPEATKDACYSCGQTWPLGQWLDAPYRKGQSCK